MLRALGALVSQADASGLATLTLPVALYDEEAEGVGARVPVLARARAVIEVIKVRSTWRGGRSPLYINHSRWVESATPVRLTCAPCPAVPRRLAARVARQARWRRLGGGRREARPHAP